MTDAPFQMTRHLARLRSARHPAARPRITQWSLVALLIGTAAIPAFAAPPHHGRDAGRHEQQELDSAGKRGSKRRPVQKTYASDQAIAIPAEAEEREFGPADPYPSTIAVTGFKKGKTADLNLTLRGFSHTFTRDVDVLLVAPNGRNAFVMGDIGGSGELSDATDLTITLDDEAATPLPLGGEEELTSGTFQPLDPSDVDDGDADLEDFPAPSPTPSGETALSTFDGSNPNGLWRLFIIDDFDGETGALSDGWTLTIKATAKVKTKKNKHRHVNTRRRI